MFSFLYDGALYKACNRNAYTTHMYYSQLKAHEIDFTLVNLSSKHFCAFITYHHIVISYCIWSENWWECEECFITNNISLELNNKKYIEHFLTLIWCVLSFKICLPKLFIISSNNYLLKISNNWNLLSKRKLRLHSKLSLKCI